MWWEITVWMSAALVVATLAQYPSIENDTRAEDTPHHITPPAFNAAQDSFVIVSEERVASEEASSETEALSYEKVTRTNEHTTNKNKSLKKILSTKTDNLYRTAGGALEVGGNDEESQNGENFGPLIMDYDDNGEGNETGTTPGDKDNNLPIAIKPEGGGSGDNDGIEPELVGSAEAVGDGMIIETTTGPVRGHAWQNDANIISYIDIRYGTFRSPFEAPVPSDTWIAVHDVRDHTKRCPQIQDDLYVGDIDCLTLSIFTPLNAVNASVLFHIHEGNFRNGSANPALYGPEYLVSNGIILVLPNYRLGALGFLCLQNITAPGNAALKDLSLALSWIKDNIARFGGNPENIAVSGDGTAGALAGYLALSPMSKDNVTKVITESGSVLSHWSLDRYPLVVATDLANRINGFQSWQAVETSALVRAAQNIPLRPCLERSTDNGVHFMVDTPWKIIHNQTNNITFMIGCAKYAGVHEYMTLRESNIQQINNDIGLLLPNDLQFKTSDERNRVGNKVKTQYFGEAAITVSDVERLSLYYTDAKYLSPAIRTARPLVRSGATVYFYEFSFVGEFNRELQAINQPVYGAVKGDIIGYLFTQDGIVPSDNTVERRMVNQLIELWTTFLQNGTPSTGDLLWNRLENVSASNEQWLYISDRLERRIGLHLDRLSLWTEIYNEHFIERNLAFETSASVYTVFILQLTFFINVFKNASHLS